MQTALRPLAFCIVMALLAASAAAMPTLNTELVAVPAPAPVTIDGDLADWDLSGTIYSCPDTQLYAELGAVRTAAMYDADGLYLSLRWVGLSPQQYVINARLALAKELLRGTSLTMADIAARSGHGDGFQFSKQFKQRTGMTPSAYRARTRA